MQQEMQWLAPVMIETNKTSAFGMDPHSHDRVEFLYCKSGEMSCISWYAEALPPKIVKCHESELCIIPPNVIHSIQTSAPVEYLVMEFISAPIPETYYNICKNFNYKKFIGNSCLVINDTTNFYALLNDLKQHFFDPHLHEKNEYTDALLFCILNRLDQSFTNPKVSDRGNIYINSALSFIAEHLVKKISKRDLASHVGVSQQYLNRLFRQTFGMNATEYINQKKLELSLTYLHNTDYSIEQIATLSGFGSIQAYDKIFRKQYKNSPSKFRSENSHQVLRTSKLKETKYQSCNIFIDML